MHDGPRAFRFELAGNLDEEGARRLDQDWRTASSVIGDRCRIVDITFLTDIDEHGRELLGRWYREGAQIIADSKHSRELAEWILGEPLPDAREDATAAVSNRTWLPFRTLYAFVAAFLLTTGVSAATLTQETVAAWNEYVKAANANLQDRVRPGGSFLWAFEKPDRAAKIRNGEIVVAPVSKQIPLKIGGGLIHHWIGAEYIPNLKLDDVLAVTRDYDRYTEIYRPSVIYSKTITREESDDEFSMMLMNKAFFLKTALDADYRATNVHLDKNRVYITSRTTRVQEIEDYGRPGEHRIPEGLGGGYIWKLYSIARLEQRDGGVYIELEAMALSRDIPGVLHVFVDSIVRRVSRNSLLTSLQQTQAAVRDSATVAMSVRPGLGSNRVRGANIPISVSGYREK
jgi:hypothetical protein